jgi:alkylresorcinol/alkylpyrone synthase
VALARATDFLTAHPKEAALVLALEFSSLTFQRWDRSATNVISTAIFGDGGAAVVLVGRQHSRFADGRVRIRDTASRFFSGTSHYMGFRLRNQGLQIILDRAVSAFVRREIGGAVEGFLASRGLTRSEVSRWILHPGGRRVIEAMTEALGLQPRDLAATERVLSEHGNMSSVTVLFVLEEILRTEAPPPGEMGVLGAFGPGFGAEFALLEFC